MPNKWSAYRADALLLLLTLLCLLPFLGKAFNIDDPLFIWAAQQIVKHPLDPYGFKVVWYVTEKPMFEVTKNPPLGAYYAAAVGSIAGWSETALHLGFLLPAIALILGTYHLAREFTRSAWLAAAATLLTPGVLVSSTSVMCDVMMLAIWVLAVLFWIKGLEPVKPVYLFASALFMAVCPLTKYFGLALIPLLLVYSLVKLRRPGTWVFYLLIPIAAVLAYQYWTHSLYGRGLLSDAAQYARVRRDNPTWTFITNAIAGLSFVGGCAIPALAFVPYLWSRRQIVAGAVLSVIAGIFMGKGATALTALTLHGPQLGKILQLTLCIAGGISVLALAVTDLWKRRDAQSVLLVLWILGTFVFASFLNWTINARSVLPLIPAFGILLARRLESRPGELLLKFPRLLFVPLVLCGLLSFWVASADAALADSARQAASLIHQDFSKPGQSVAFEGHWGFQYYMQLYGARPIDVSTYRLNAGDLIVIPENNSNIFGVPPQAVASEQLMEIKVSPRLATMRSDVGAGFYASGWGPLPFAFGAVPPERYFIVTVAAAPGSIPQP